MITHALAPLLACKKIDKIYIVCEDIYHNEILADIQAEGLNPDKIAGFTNPGETRQFSIYKGLEAILKGRDISEDDTVLIHDAARPFLSTELLERCFKALPGHDGVMPALPMKDTVYISTNGNSISGLLDRKTLYAGQAPELFLLKKYYEANKALLPDRIESINGASEPAVLYGMDIVIADGDEKNVKVTSEEDLGSFVEACHSERK